MDSVGVGELPDASRYGDRGSDTLGNIARRIPLRVPALRSLGLARVARIGGASIPARGAFGRMAERSPGKDSVTGHWELTGVVLDRPFPTFPQGFPRDVMAEFERRIGRRTLGNTVASGTVIIERLGAEHLRTGAPIVYTSADSVFQIAAHEEVVPVAELYRMCETAFDLVCRGRGVGRVIARPFVGAPGAFMRTSNRRDFALEPFAETLLDRLKAAGAAGRRDRQDSRISSPAAVSRHAIHTASDDHGHGCGRARAGARAARIDLRESRRLRRPVRSSEQRRRGTPRTSSASTRGSQRSCRRSVPRTCCSSRPITGTIRRRRRPITPASSCRCLAAGPAVRAGVDLGTRATFADLGQTVAALFDVRPLDHGTSFLRELLG